MAVFLSLCHAQAFADSQSGSGKVSYLEDRLQLEQEARKNRYALLKHKSNYILPFAYNSDPNQDPYTEISGAGEEPIDKAEFKFQISVKLPLAQGLLAENDTLYVGYTQKSFWQIYNELFSAPFRDTNFNPEMFYQLKTNNAFLGMNVRLLTIGFEHESNGRPEPSSRSWNRLYGSVAAERGNLALGVKVWHRIPEDENEDNNPDILEYMGHTELNAQYKVGGHVLGMMFRPAWMAGFNYGVQLDWSFPFPGNMQGYVHYYYGYGESLIDYNHANNRIGVGVILNNWM